MNEFRKKLGGHIEKSLVVVVIVETAGVVVVEEVLKSVWTSKFKTTRRLTSTPRTEESVLDRLPCICLSTRYPRSINPSDENGKRLTIRYSDISTLGPDPPPEQL